MRPLLSSPSHLWTSSASLSHLAAMSASIAFAGSVGACSVKARQSAARPRYQLVLDVISLCPLTIPQRDANDAALVEYTMLLGILLIAVIAHHLAVDQRHSCDDRDSL